MGCSGALDRWGKRLAYEIMNNVLTAHGTSAGLIYTWCSQPLPSCSRVEQWFHRDHVAHQVRWMRMLEQGIFWLARARCMLHCPDGVSGRRGLHIPRYSRLSNSHRGWSGPVQRQRSSVRDDGNSSGMVVASLGTAVEGSESSPSTGRNNTTDGLAQGTTASPSVSRELPMQWEPLNRPRRHRRGPDRAVQRSPKRHRTRTLERQLA